MEIRKFTGKLPAVLKKYRYPVLILVIGLILLQIPWQKEEQEAEVTQVTQQLQQPDMTAQLEQILSKIQGVGQVEVMLTEAVSESYDYHYNEDSTASEGGSSTNKDMVTITDGSRVENPVLYQIRSPKYLGAIVVCKGAQDPQVKLAVVEAVSKLTGLGADAICVLKMK